MTIETPEHYTVDQQNPNYYQVDYECPCCKQGYTVGYVKRNPYIQNPPDPFRFVPMEPYLCDYLKDTEAYNERGTAEEMIKSLIAHHQEQLRSMK